VDTLEFIALCRAMDADPVKLFKKLVAQAPMDRPVIRIEESDQGDYAVTVGGEGPSEDSPEGQVADLIAKLLATMAEKEPKGTA